MELVDIYSYAENKQLKNILTSSIYVCELEISFVESEYCADVRPSCSCAVLLPNDSTAPKFRGFPSGTRPPATGSRFS